MGLKEIYDAVVNLREILHAELNIDDNLIDQPANYRHIKALAATYELQEYLASRLAATVDISILKRKWTAK